MHAVYVYVYMCIYVCKWTRDNIVIEAILAGIITHLCSCWYCPLIEEEGEEEESAWSHRLPKYTRHACLHTCTIYIYIYYIHNNTYKSILYV